MPVFKYAMKRILTSPSTYIILLIFLLIPIVALSIWRGNFELIGTNLSPALLTWSILTGFVMSFFNGYFVGALIAKNVSEEIQDGSFLLIISKPLSRMRILTEKMLTILIVMFIGFIIVSFLPLLTFFLPRLGDRAAFFATLWPLFWQYFAVGCLIQLFIFSFFTIFAWFFSPRVMTTTISLFATLIVIINIILNTLTGSTMYDWISQWYIYVPIIITIIGLMPINWYLFKNHDFS